MDVESIDMISYKLEWKHIMFVCAPMHVHAFIIIISIYMYIYKYVCIVSLQHYIEDYFLCSKVCIVFGGTQVWT
jgi:hypothetical protein